MRGASTKINIVSQAMKLRAEGLSYTSISVVMRLYHGETKTDVAWRNILRRQGVPPKHYVSNTRAFR